MFPDLQVDLPLLSCASYSANVVGGSNLVNFVCEVNSKLIHLFSESSYCVLLLNREIISGIMWPLSNVQTS